MRQRTLGLHTPPCHGRMVITTLGSISSAFRGAGGGSVRFSGEGGGGCSSFREGALGGGFGGGGGLGGGRHCAGGGVQATWGFVKGSGFGGGGVASLTMTPTRAVLFYILHRCIFVVKMNGSNISSQRGVPWRYTRFIVMNHHSLTGCVAPCGPRTWRLPMSAHRVTLRHRSIVAARMLRVAHRKNMRATVYTSAQR